MTEEELSEEIRIAKRLKERAICEVEHTDLRVPDSGFGWTGTRCSRCGFSFFGKWDDGFMEMVRSVLHP